MNTQFSFAKRFQLPLDTLEINFKRIGIMGKGFDYLLELSSVVYMMQDQSEKLLFVCQEYQGITASQIQTKLERLILTADHHYVATYMKFMAWVVEEVGGNMKQDQKETTYVFYVIYDYQFVEYDLHTYAELRSKQNELFNEDEVWEILSYLILTFEIASRETLEYTDVEPFSIYVSKSPYVKYIMGNLNLRVPTSKWEENQFYCHYSDELVQGKRGLKSVEKNYVYRLAMLALYLLGGKSFRVFNQSILKDGKFVWNIQQRVQEQKNNISEKMTNFLEQCLTKSEDQRPNVKDLIQSYKEQLFKGLEYFEGQLNQVENIDNQSFKGLIRKKEDKTILNGLGNTETQKGMFQSNQLFGPGIQQFKGITVYGEWHQGKMSSGIIANKNYIFFGEFQDYKLTKARGRRYFLSEMIDSHQDQNLYEEGTFKNDVLAYTK